MNSSTNTTPVAPEGFNLFIYRVKKKFTGPDPYLTVAGVFLWLSIRQHQAGRANAHAFQAKNHSNWAAYSLAIFRHQDFHFRPFGRRIARDFVVLGPSELREQGARQTGQ